jgi:CRISPR/Cas system Type II protein with McrA/HNH and RuvC-like nuclease domain
VYIKASTRRAVWERDNSTCQHCETQERLTIDHIIPVSRGGSDELDNLQILCRSCNARKGNGANAVPDPEAMAAMVERLTAAVEAEAQAKRRFHDAIRRSRRNGKTLRHIAGLVGLSVETVRQITMKETP